MTNTKTSRIRGRLQFPDPPEGKPEEMTSFNHLNVTGSVYLLTKHFGSPGTTLVAGEHYVSPTPTGDMAGLRYPDLLIAFNVDPAVYYRSNAYIISEQGKPPDFVLEIASNSTGRTDAGDKREDYAALSIPEYWRFDETGRLHGARLAGDRLVEGRYEPILIDELAEGILQGYSRVLNLYLRWEQGQLRWHDPATGRNIMTYDDQRARADDERQARIRAESRVRELEEQLRRRDA